MIQSIISFCIRICHPNSSRHIIIFVKARACKFHNRQESKCKISLSHDLSCLSVIYCDWVKRSTLKVFKIGSFRQRFFLNAKFHIFGIFQISRTTDFIVLLLHIFLRNTLKIAIAFSIKHGSFTIDHKGINQLCNIKLSTLILIQYRISILIINTE